MGEHRAEDPGQHVAAQQVGRARAERPGRGDVRRRPLGGCGGAGVHRQRGPRHEGHRQRGPTGARARGAGHHHPDEGGRGDGEDDRGGRGGRGAGEHPDRQSDPEAHRAHVHRGAQGGQGPVREPGPQVAPHGVGAQRQPRRGGCQAAGLLDAVRVAEQAADENDRAEPEQREARASPPRRRGRPWRRASPSRGRS
ncbi:hypothetical protein GCM10027047_29850 [Rhodococcus aerolatus]